MRALGSGYLRSCFHYFWRSVFTLKLLKTYIPLRSRKRKIFEKCLKKKCSGFGFFFFGSNTDTKIGPWLRFSITKPNFSRLYFTKPKIVSAISSMASFCIVNDSCPVDKDTSVFIKCLKGRFPLPFWISNETKGLTYKFDRYLYYEDL